MMRRTLALLSFILTMAGGSYGFNGGDGSVGNPYQIATPAHLENVNSDLSASYILMNDIDLAGMTFTAAVIAPDLDETTEGFVGERFTGSFDGNGKTIRNLTVSGACHVGLFGVTGRGAAIFDLRLEDVNLTGVQRVGGLVGHANAADIHNCHTSGIVYASDHSAGGLVGRNYYSNSFTACSSSCTVAAVKQRAGGLIGWSSGTPIVDCHASGPVTGGAQVGGLIGNKYIGSVNQCTASGLVVQTGKGECAGGLVGSLNQGQVHNCSATGNVAGGGRVGGLIGNVNHGIVTTSRAEGSVVSRGASFPAVGGLVGQFHTSTMIACYAAGNVEGLARVGGLAGNSYNSHIYDSGAVGNVKATGDGSKDVRYAGGLVGQHHTGSITGSYATGNVTAGVRRVGGLVGNNYRGAITYSYATGTVTTTALEVGGFTGFNCGGAIHHCYAAGAVQGAGMVGGFVGANDGTLSVITDSYARGMAAGTGDFTGGFVGRNNAPIKQCYAAGKVTTGGSHGHTTGGFAGFTDEKATVVNSFFDAETTGVITDHSGAVGVSTADLKTVATFSTAGWDVSGSWYAADGQYPAVYRLSTAYAAPFDGGNGTASNPYQISKASQLHSVNEHPTAHFVMTGPIDAGSLTLERALIAPQLIAFRGWHHPWFAGVPFAGIFDGGGFAIRNLTIQNDNDKNSNIGVFGRITRGGVVRNLGVENVNIQARPSRRTGALAGSVLGGTISNCYATGVVVGDDITGGLVGDLLGGVIEDSYTNVALTCGSWSGGLVGRVRNAHEGPQSNPSLYATPRVVNAYALGDIIHFASTTFEPTEETPVGAASRVGGLVGYAQHNAVIDNCYATGNIALDEQATSWASGGLVGVLDMGSGIARSWASGNVTGHERVGGLVGYVVGNSSITHSHATGDVQGRADQDRVGGLAGHLRDSLVDDCYATGDVVGGRDRIGGLVGNSHDALVHNSYATGNVTGQRDFIGGLVGQNYTTSIVNCHAVGSVTGGGQRIGGLVGNNSRSAVAHSYATGAVVKEGFGEHVGGLAGSNSSGVIYNCYATGAVSGYSLVGGFVGRNTGAVSIVSNSYATGPVSGNGSGIGGFIGDNCTLVEHCYSTGQVTALDEETAGGFAGISGSRATANNCFWDTETSGMLYSQAGEGKTTVQLKTLRAPAAIEGIAENLRAASDPIRFAEKTAQPAASFLLSVEADADENIPVRTLFDLRGDTNARSGDLVAAWALYEIGRSHFDAHNYQAAVEAVQQAIAKDAFDDPMTASALLLLARCYIQQDRQEDVQDVIDEILVKYGSLDSLTYILLIMGEEYVLTGMRVNNKQMYVKSIEFFGTYHHLISQNSRHDAIMHYTLGNIYRNMGDYAKAAEAFELASLSDPTFKFSDTSLYAALRCYERLAAKDAISNKAMQIAVSRLSNRLRTEYPDSRYLLHP